jgi:hypothetical protein
MVLYSSIWVLSHSRSCPCNGSFITPSSTATSCDPLHGFLAGLQFECLQALIRKSKLDFPNTAFILNLHDLTVCDKASRCPAPIFSTYGHKTPWTL